MSQEDITATPVAAVEKREKKDKKKDKKRKADALTTAQDAAVAPESVVEEKKVKKSKKDKKSKADSQSAEAAAPEASTSTKSSKKDKKSKKEAQSVETAEPTASSSAVATSAPSLESAMASQADSDAFLATHNITLKPTPYRLFLDFATLPIKPEFRPYLKDYKQPTPIQAASWPKLFAGDDVIGIAETGSGKTLTFGLPGLQLLTTLPASINAVKGKGKGNTNPIQLLVLAPTRELALQTYDTVSALGKFVGIEAVCLFGDMSRDDQSRQVKQKDVRVVVGTPGRILDLANSGDVDFSK
jgi:ATP-dependent RNA helicase DBP3